jgi:hypothetical protein
MNAESKLPRLILFSPWFLLVFLVLPLAVILCLTLHIELPLIGFGSLLVNNICFALLAVCRFVWYLSRAGKGIRYGATLQRPRGSFETSLSCAGATGALAGAGFAFIRGEGYGEKRDLGYLGTTFLYGGLSLLLATGCWGNLRQFSGTLLDGIGPATKLSEAGVYRSLTMGPFAAKLSLMPQLKILSQILPDHTYPKGATEIALIPEHGPPVTTVLFPGVPFHYGAYDFTMSKIVFQPELVIKAKDSRVLFDSFIQLDPLVQKRGDFSFYGSFTGDEVLGGAYFQPEKNLLMLVVTRNGKRVVADLQFQIDQQVVAGDYILSCAKLGQWSEINIVHRRHVALLWVGGFIALVGLAMRIAIRPQRVWLEESAGGCRVTAVGKETLSLIGKVSVR